MSNLYNTIIINDEAFNCYSSMSLYDILIYLNFDTTKVVVEYNNRLVSSDQFCNIVVSHQDKLEVITIVGGG